MPRILKGIAMNIKCFFGRHEWEYISFKPNGKIVLNWALRQVPQYDRKEKCKSCGKPRTEQFITMADRPIDQ